MIRRPRGPRHPGRTLPLRFTFVVALLGVVATLAPPAAAQQVISQPTRTLNLAKGASMLLINPVTLTRFSVGDPEIAEAVAITPREILINAKGLGSTSLILWDSTTGPRMYAIEVTVDAPALQRYLNEILVGEDIQVSASGNQVTLTGTVKHPDVVNRAITIAQGTGATVIDNLVAPPAVQVLLQVRFAEIARSAMKEFSTQLSSLNPQKLSDDGDWLGETVSDGLMSLLLSNPNANLDVAIRAATSKGYFRSLAEPNLLTLPGKEASFLAGGEFPFPSIQSGNATGGISIVFKDFGIKLKFTPTLTRNGAIRLKVAPEVSSLDFANGLVISGFLIPTILTRRAETEVELFEGQFLAIAGLIDNVTTTNVTKIPVLGDIPILGQFFRSTSAAHRETELIVIITPRIVTGQIDPIAVPTGEPPSWGRPGWMNRERTGSVRP